MATVGVGCHQIVQSEQSHECPPARAVPEPPAPLHGIPHVGGRPAAAGSRVNSCSPANVRTKGFPVNPGAAMPVVNGCRKQDYAVLIVVGLPVTH